MTSQELVVTSTQPYLRRLEDVAFRIIPQLVDTKRHRANDWAAQLEASRHRGARRKGRIHSSIYRAY
jgi:hypothetical protein